MFLGYQGEKIKFYTEQELNPALYNLDKVEETEDEYVLEGDEYVLKDVEWEERERQREQARIQALFMTRSDFFDGTIRAFGADEDDLLVAIGLVLENITMDPVEKKVAINNFKNALNFYRKHPLFTLLSDKPIPISEGITVTITSTQWDKFFDETSKKNPDAYKELLPTEESVEGENVGS